MKKTLLLVSSFFSLLAVNAQNLPVSQVAANKNAVLEELTGINCQYCPDGHKRAQEIKDANPGRVILVNVHAGGYASGTPNLKTTDGDLLDPFFNPSGYPAGAVQRTPHSSDMTAIATGRGNWAGQVSTVLSAASPVNVALNATVDASTREVTVTVEVFYTSPFTAGTNHYLNVGILQNNFEGPQVGSALNPTAVLPNGNYLHQHIFRGYINTGGTWGQSIAASSAGVITQTYTYTLPANINGTPLEIGQLEFFAIVHAGHNAATTSQIFTGAETTPIYTNVPPATASNAGIVNSLDVCAGESIIPVVKVTNAGEAITSINFSTSINGGTAVPYTHNGTIPQFGSAEITLPSMSFTPLATNNVQVVITSVNGGTGSIGTVSTSTKPINVGDAVNSLTGTAKMTTDRYGSELTWEIRNSSNVVVASGGPYTDATGSGAFPQADVNFTMLANECYTVKVEDAYGDGFDSGYGNGNFQVMAGGVEVAAVATFSGSEAIDKMKTASSASINEVTAAIGMEVYPNPAVNVVNVKFEANGGDYSLAITDLAGRAVTSTVITNANGLQNVALPIEGLVAGNYLITVAKDGATFTQNLIVR